MTRTVQAAEAQIMMMTRMAVTVTSHNGVAAVCRRATRYVALLRGRHGTNLEAAAACRRRGRSGPGASGTLIPYEIIYDLLIFFICV